MTMLTEAQTHSSAAAGVPESVSSYPRSRASVSSDCPIVRSRTWSEDITKNWNVPITGVELFSERAQRYLLYFKMTPAQMKIIYDKFLVEMKAGLEMHKEDPKAQWEPARCSLKMIDTHVTESMIPRGDELSTTVALDVGSNDSGLARAVKVVLQGNGKVTTQEVGNSLRDERSEFPKGLLDRNASASHLFDSMATLVKVLKEQKGMNEPIPVGLSFCFPVDQRGLNSATLIHWAKGFETGRTTNDPVEGMDVAALGDCAFWRLGVNAKTVAVLNDTTGALLGCSYEKDASLPPCRLGFILSGGVNGCYVEPMARLFNYKGDVINSELGSFDKSLPITDVDLEVDFADEPAAGVQLFEKLVATTYLGELCRRVVVKVWQSEAPHLAWVRYSMPWVACAKVIEDETDDMSITREILTGLWDWQTKVEERRVVRELFQAVFDRSAALASVAIVALAQQTGRLQPAMGGLTCAVAGPLYSRCPRYARKVRSYMEVVIDKETVQLIKLHEVHDGSAKGAGILAHMTQQRK